MTVARILGEPPWSEYDHAGDWVWREDLVQHLLADDHGDLLFASGCATNQAKFHQQFDEIVLLSAPAEVLIARLQSRSNN